MARASIIHVILTEDPNTFPVVAVATVKHELVNALAIAVHHGADLKAMPWRYVRMKDIGADVLALKREFEGESNHSMAGAVSAYEFWVTETRD